MNFDPENQLYSDPMAGKAGLAGRPSKKKATESGARLAALRKQAGLSQAALAEVVGIPQRTVSFYEREGGYIPSTLVPQLAKALGVSLEDVLGMATARSALSAAPSPNSNASSKPLPLYRATNSRRFSLSSRP